MKRVITYGTFDLFHEGHRRLLERARNLGEYLIVGVTTEGYDDSRGKLNVRESLIKRIEHVKESGLADEIIIEEYEGQKINDIQKHSIDIFAIGSDWKGKFDYLNEYCTVVYLERTKGISSSQIRAASNGVIRMGVVGYGRIANRFVPEARFVSGVNIEGVFGPSVSKMENFIKHHQLSFADKDFNSFLHKVDAIYIASPHLSHYEYTMKALEQQKHVLCEKPMVLRRHEAEKLFSVAKQNGCLLLEGIKTAYAPGFNRMIALAKSGAIGDIKSIEATFTKLAEENSRELKRDSAGGSISELASYPLLAVVKLLGEKYIEFDQFSYIDSITGIDLFNKINIRYKDAIATVKVALGVKSEGDLVISGTKGYVYVPAPWWKTEYFETRFENPTNNRKYYQAFAGEGLRYELSEFVSLVQRDLLSTYKLSESDSIWIADVIEKLREGKCRKLI
ncbi:Gfo/Idh/MocA family oxidoreductase [Anoxynatronum sibiricum]|uniref:Gfo/Idh/MocA family oxidoreductase n=1 Tax=Anoxynatronum sibiricum TaxID=210623 RepID=A0ABU9VXB4_9CLOT